MRTTPPWLVTGTDHAPWLVTDTDHAPWLVTDTDHAPVVGDRYGPRPRGGAPLGVPDPAWRSIRARCTLRRTGPTRHGRPSPQRHRTTPPWLVTDTGRSPCGADLRPSPPQGPLAPLALAS